MDTPQIIAGKYEVLGIIGKGGMGTVYRAHHRNLERTVAIKMLSEELAADGEFRARFQQEATLVARLSHPNIVNVFDIEAHGDTFCIIMEYVEGESLQARIEREGKLPQEMVIEIGAQVARALHHAHGRGVVHRDIKPDNILITASGLAKVMDFGIARFVDSKLKTQTGISMGTPKYMSPEQVTGKNIDGQTDLYSLGVCMYTALTGQVPFDGENPIEIATKHLYEPAPGIREHNPEVSESVEKAVLLALDKSKALRYSTGEQMAEALEDALRHGPAQQMGEHGSKSVAMGATQRMPRPQFTALESATGTLTPPHSVAEDDKVTPPRIIRDSSPIPASASYVRPNEAELPSASEITPPLEPKVAAPAKRPLSHAWIAIAVLALVAIAVAIAVWRSNMAATPGPKPTAETEYNAVVRSANALLAEGRTQEAREKLVAFRAAYGDFRPSEVDQRIDLLTSQLPLRQNSAELAKRRELKGEEFMNEKTKHRLPLARAYLEGAQALNNEPYKHSSRIKLLARDMENQRAMIPAEDVERARALATQAIESSASLSQAADQLMDAIALHPWNFDFWLKLAAIYEREGLRDDARVLTFYVDRNTSPGSPEKTRATELLNRLD